MGKLHCFPVSSLGPSESYPRPRDLQVTDSPNNDESRVKLNDRLGVIKRAFSPGAARTRVLRIKQDQYSGIRDHGLFGRPYVAGRDRQVAFSECFDVLLAHRLGLVCGQTNRKSIPKVAGGLIERVFLLDESSEESAPVVRLTVADRIVQ